MTGWPWAEAVTAGWLPSQFIDYNVYYVNRSTYHHKLAWVIDGQVLYIGCGNDSLNPKP